MVYGDKFSDPHMEAALTLGYQLVGCAEHFIGSSCESCEPHFYRDRCDVYCLPVEGNYTCDQSTGNKICGPGKTGDDCDQSENENSPGLSVGMFLYIPVAVIVIMC